MNTSSRPSDIRNHPVRIAIIGLGHIGEVHIAALEQLPGFKLVAVCDRQTELRSVVQEAVEFYDNREEMLSCGGFDTVIVATPNSLHNAMALDTLRAGFNVIVEKPAACSLEELDLLEETALQTGRHVYYAFHASCALEVRWIFDHLQVQENLQNYGPLTAFFSRFYDPYIDANDRVVEHAGGLDDCWSDSGVNALSVLDRFLPVDHLWVDSTRQSGQAVTFPGVRSKSVRFGFGVGRNDASGLGVIETAWDQGINFKCTELYFGCTGWKLVVDHSAQAVTEIGLDACAREMVRFSGERLLNHYLGVFKDYLRRYEQGNMNGIVARRIHEQLFAGQ